mgnify:CR=1 FL=1
MHGERWLDQCLGSLINSNIILNIIVVDNNSTDRTLEIAKRHDTRVFKIKKFLPGKAINLPVKNIKSKFVVCLSAHCIPTDKNWLKNLLKPFKKKNISVVYGSRVLQKKRYKLKSFSSLERIFYNHVLTIISNIINDQRLTIMKETICTDVQEDGQ